MHPPVSPQSVLLNAGILLPTSFVPAHENGTRAEEALSSRADAEATPPEALCRRKLARERLLRFILENHRRRQVDARRNLPLAGA